MRGGRLIVIAGVAIGLIAGVLVILLMMKGSSGANTVAPTPEPATVVRAAQNIPKGTEIALDAIQLVQLDAGEATPPGAVDDPVAVAGMTAAMDIPQGTILQAEMYFDLNALAEQGTSRASTLFEPGRVAVSMPVGELSSVAGAIRAGDHIDILATFESVDVDTGSQALLPLDGSVEQLPRMESQLLLQNVEVLRVGLWGTGPDAGAADEKSSTGGPDVLTLLMPQQDALVLQWLMVKLEENQARFTLVLRSQDDDEIMTTEAVTLDYLMKRFKIIVPPKAPTTIMVIEGQGTIEPN
jgi:Flp pilus assembly protein CpaB